MSGFKLSPEAFRDIEEIWEFIAEDNLDAADRVREKIFTACEKIAELPGMGHLRKDLADEPLRFWPVYSYLISTGPTQNRSKSCASYMVPETLNGSFRRRVDNSTVAIPIDHCLNQSPPA